MAEIANLLVSIGADIKDLKSKMSQVQNVVKKTGDDIKKEFGKKFTDNISGAVAGAFAAGAIINFGKEVIAITAEFQKFEAVLTNTLGSNSDAQIAMLQLQEFAAKTPFSVAELTESFVKLANQGFKPTTDQLRSLGDLAASTGKSFNQLTEAIIDAQTGEFERLKEFGIRAQKQGDQVTFSFKGVKTQVDFTNESIQKYLLGLGDLKGVSGAMGAISQTLGGKISNLGDSFDQLYVTIGNLTQGPIVWFIDGVNDMLQVSARLLKSQEQLEKEDHLKKIGKEVEELSGRYNQLVEDAKKYQNLDEAEAKTNAYYQLSKEFQNIIKLREKEIELISKELDLVDDPTDKQLESQAKRFSEAKKGLELAQAQLDALEKIRNPSTEGQEQILGLLEAERKKLKEVKEARESATSEKAIAGYNRQIEAIQKTIERLEKLGQTYGLIQQYANKIAEAEEKRQKATTLEGVGKYNDIKEGLQEYADLLDEVSIKEYELSKIEIKPLTPIASTGVIVGTTAAIEILKEYQEALSLAEKQNQVFGSSFDFVGAKIKLLEDAITALLESGTYPLSPVIEGLNNQLKELRGTINQMVLDLSGPLSDMISSLAESFGELAVGAASVDDFGKAILMAMGDFVGQLGKMMIATGIARLALEQVLENPYGAIAAGAALVALGAASKAILKKGPSSSTPSISAGPQKGAGNFGSASAYLGYNSMSVQVEGTIKGRDINISSKKTTNADQRFGR